MIMIMLHVKQNQTKLSKNCHPYYTRIRSGYISYERQFDERWDEQNQLTIINNVPLGGKSKKTRVCFLQVRTTVVVLPANVAAGHSRGPAQACGCAGSLDRTRMVNHHILSSLLLFLIYDKSTFHTLNDTAVIIEVYNIHQFNRSYSQLTFFIFFVKHYQVPGNTPGARQSTCSSIGPLIRKQPTLKKFFK